MNLLLISAIFSVVGAVLAICTYKAPNAAKFLGCIFGILAACAAIGAGIVGIIGAQSMSVTTPFAFANFSLRITPLSGLLLIVINVLALMAWIYGLSYFDEYKRRGVGAIGMFMNFFIISMNMVLTSDNAFWFLVFFELMSLTSYFLVITEQNKQSVHGGFLYLVMAHVGFLMIMIAFLIMAATTGSFEFETFRNTEFSPAIASIVFLLGFAGFGCKAGMFPFHSWLPQAHPAAPSNVSSLMSGGMIKIGVFGMILVGLDLLGSCDCQLWWGLTILTIGAISSVLGVAYALDEHDIKKLLAYHSVENIGIILLGVGIGFIGVAIDQPVLAGLGMMAGLFHLVNHAMFKGLLFLGAGSVLYSTGTRNMNILGGLTKVMPVTSVCFLIGSLAISAIPPLNGFVSEWFTYQSLFTAAMDNGPLIIVFCAVAAVALALTGALAVTCFVKAYGVTFLGAPRSEGARKAREVPGAMLVSMIVLAVICICLGVGAPWITPTIESIATSVTQGAPLVVAGTIETVNPALGSAMSTPLLAFLLIICILLPLAFRAAFRSGGMAHDRDPWACGYLPTADMPVIATTFGSDIKMFLSPLYTARDAIVSTSSGFSAAFQKTVRGTDKAQSWGDRFLVDPIAALVSLTSRAVARIEGGNHRVYILYIVGALVIFLVLAVLL